jgi:hypothetical protein
MAKTRVRCSIIFYYDPDTYTYDWDDEEPSPDVNTILDRCKQMMFEDVTDLQNPLDFNSITAEFVEESDV